MAKSWHSHTLSNSVLQNSPSISHLNVTVQPSRATSQPWQRNAVIQPLNYIVQHLSFFWYRNSITSFQLLRLMPINFRSSPFVGVIMLHAVIRELCSDQLSGSGKMWVGFQHHNFGWKITLLTYVYSTQNGKREC